MHASHSHTSRSPASRWDDAMAVIDKLLLPLLMVLAAAVAATYVFVFQRLLCHQFSDNCRAVPAFFPLLAVCYQFQAVLVAMLLCVWLGATQRFVSATLGWAWATLIATVVALLALLGLLDADTAEVALLTVTIIDIVAVVLTVVALMAYQLITARFMKGKLRVLEEKLESKLAMERYRRLTKLQARTLRRLATIADLDATLVAVFLLMMVVYQFVIYAGGLTVELYLLVFALQVFHMVAFIMVLAVAPSPEIFDLLQERDKTHITLPLLAAVGVVVILDLVCQAATVALLSINIYQAPNFGLAGVLSVVLLVMAALFVLIDAYYLVALGNLQGDWWKLMRHQKGLLREKEE